MERDMTDQRKEVINQLHELNILLLHTLSLIHI